VAIEQDIPVVERIAQAIEAALKGIKTARGYRLDVQDVLRPRRFDEDWSPKDLTIVLLQGNAEPNENFSLVGNPPIVAWDQSFLLDLIVVPQEAAGTPLDERLNLFDAEVVRAVMADPQWADPQGTCLTRLACDTRLGGIQMWREAHGATRTVHVIYRTPENDPYQRA
jgi:hypothetical protein